MTLIIFGIPFIIALPSLSSFPSTPFRLHSVWIPLTQSSRLIINILCSTTSLVASLVEVYLYLTSRLNPLITLFANTLLAFFWLTACFYQSVALGKLRRIVDKMCPHEFRSRFLWCQNPKMTLLFSGLAL